MTAIFLNILLLNIFISLIASDQKDGAVLKKVYKCLCGQTGAGKNPKFIQCLSGCQDKYPYTIKDNRKPHFLTRNALYKKRELTNENRLAMCKHADIYVENLKRQIADFKGPIDPKYDSEDKLTDFFEGKKHCFLKCCKQFDAD